VAVAKVYTCAVVGLDGELVEVEVDIASGLPAFHVVGLPDTGYHRDTVLPAIQSMIDELGLGPVVTEHEGQALQDLQRAAMGIAKSRCCVIDTTHGAPSRALYLGMAQGYRKPFANLIDAQTDPEKRVFTNARSKSVIDYRDSAELLPRLRDALQRMKM